MMTTTLEDDLKALKNIKKEICDVTLRANVGHVPSCLSSLEILYVLYTKIVNITLKNAKDKIRDRVIISKEHCYAARICLLAELGLIPKEYLKTYIKDGGYLAHDIYGLVGDEKIAALDISSGSLGHGLGVGIGLAYHNNANVYVIVGDGELQEGSCWEALLFIGHNKIKNLTVIVDVNHMQIDGYTQDIINTSDNIADKIKPLGFDVIECNGHDLAELEKAFKVKTEKPKCVVAHTIKGKETQFILDQVPAYKYHSWYILSDENYKKVLEEINK